MTPRIRTSVVIIPSLMFVLKMLLGINFLDGLSRLNLPSI